MQQLFVDFGSGPMVTTVTSLVTTECESPSTFRDTDVFVYRRWIQAQGGTDLQNATCGTLSQIGTAGSSVVTTTGQLDVFNRSGSLTFQVPPGTSLLRVALNGAVVKLRPAYCLAGDTNEDSRITVDEMVAAVNRALRGCPLT